MKTIVCHITVNHNDKWIRKIEYIHTMEYYSAMKKDGAMPYAATRTDLQIFTLSEVSQRRRNTVRHHLNAESKKEMIQRNVSLRQQN